MSNLVVFDLDGTLIDSAKDLAISMNATRQHFQMPLLDPKLIYTFVGNGAATLVKRAMGPEASEELNQRALAFFLRFYREHALENTRLYEGVPESVAELHEGGFTLAILTNKPVKISRDIVAALGLADRFAYIYGGDSFAAKKPDPQGLLSILKQTGILPERAWMVGDSGVDVQTARNAQIRSCGVTWGFQPEACLAEKPDLVVHEPRQLARSLSAAAISFREPA